MNRMIDQEIFVVKPNPRMVWLINYAIDEIVHRLERKSEYHEWLGWAASWKAGVRSPSACVSVANNCFEDKENPIRICLGQLAWGAKEACYDAPKSGWLVIRYIADAMIAFGAEFPDNFRDGLPPPIVDGEAVRGQCQLNERPSAPNPPRAP